MAMSSASAVLAFLIDAIRGGEVFELGSERRRDPEQLQGPHPALHGKGR
jgi:hypothetical protein